MKTASIRYCIVFHDFFLQFPVGHADAPILFFSKNIFFQKTKHIYLLKEEGHPHCKLRNANARLSYFNSATPEGNPSQNSGCGTLGFQPSASADSPDANNNSITDDANSPRHDCSATKCHYRCLGHDKCYLCASHSEASMASD